MSILFLSQILNGLLDGVYYLLIALGLSLIFSLGGIVNLAHGAFYAIGAYLTVVIADQLDLGFGVALVASPVAVALLGIVLERLLFRRFYRSDPILSLLLTFGLAMCAEQGLRMIFGAAPLSFGIPQQLRGQIFIGSFVYSYYRTILLGIAIVCVALLWMLLNMTAFGRVVRAGVQNPDMVGALGISLEPYMASVAALGIGLAGLAGAGGAYDAAGVAGASAAYHDQDGAQQYSRQVYLSYGGAGADDAGGSGVERRAFADCLRRGRDARSLGALWARWRACAGLGR